MNFSVCPGGQFVEEHGQPDMLGLLQQIGAMPTPGDQVPAVIVVEKSPFHQ
jgi:hypothetical protein